MLVIRLLILTSNAVKNYRSEPSTVDCTVVSQFVTYPRLSKANQLLSANPSQISSIREILPVLTLYSGDRV